MRQPANPYSKYSKKKARKDYYKNLQKMTPSERTKHNTITWIILILICVIGISFCGLEEFAKWAI